MKKTLITLAASTLLLTSCMTGYGLSGTTTGALVGGTLGSIIGGSSGNSWQSEQIGGLIGTIAGAAVGGAIDQQIAEERQRQQEQQQEQQYAHQEPPRQHHATPQPAVNPVLSLTDFRLNDQNGNGIIESGETCRISFVIKNGSSRTMHDVTPVVDLLDRTKGISVSTTKPIERIPAHSRVGYSFSIRATQRLRTGNATFRIYTVNGDGSYSEAREFSLPTHRHR